MTGRRAGLSCVGVAIALGVGACSANRESTLPVTAASATAAPDAPAQDAPSGPLRLAYLAPTVAGAGGAGSSGSPDAGAVAETSVSADPAGLHDASGRALPWPPAETRADEDVGVFGYALRETVITTEAGEPLGRLAPDARVAVLRVVPGERAEILLPAWTPASGSRAEGPLRAWVPARALADAPVGTLDSAKMAATATPPSTSTSTSAATDGGAAAPHDTRPIPLRDARWQTLAYTFCGPVEVLGEATIRGLVRAEQRDEGASLSGFVEAGEIEGSPARCTRPVLVREPPTGADAAGAPGATSGTTRLVINGHGRRYDRPETPAGLLATDVRGTKLWSLAAHKKTIFWVVDEPGNAPRCEGWTFGASKAGTAPLSTRKRLESGEELVTTFQTTVVPGTTTAQEAMVVTGPTAEVIGRGGTQRRPDRAGGQCNRQYLVVASDATSLTVFGGQVTAQATVLAYSPADAERWFTDKATCDAAIAGEKSPYATTGFAVHDVCQ